ncbi:MAG: protein kinase [Myxococcaceae bacterium]|nr:protein kinase [Myxococcaceae bacterium]
MYAVETDDGVPLAWKVGRAEVAPRFEREAAALGRLGPPHVPRLVSAGRVGPQPYLLLERLEGASLAARMADAFARPGGLAPAECLRLAARAADALAVVHAAGWCHRDVKPENLWIRTSGEICLLDFGLAKPSGPGAATGGGADLTRAEERVGTVAYMAPEQCVDSAAATEAADLYALGAVLFELVALRPPFVGDASEIRDAHVHRRPPTLASLGADWPELEPVLARCLEKDPARRFASAEELARAIRAVSLPAREASPSAEERSRSSTATQRLALLGISTRWPVDALVQEAANAGGVLAGAWEGRYLFAFPEHASAAAGLAAAERVFQRASQHGPCEAVTHVATARVRAGARAIRILGPDVSNPATWWDTAVGAGDGPRRTPAALESRSGGEQPRATRPQTEPPLVGRGEWVDELVRALAAATSSGPPTLFALAGADGLGKTRLLRELHARLEARGVRVRWLPEPDRGAPDDAAAEAERLRAEGGVFLIDDADRVDASWIHIIEAVTVADRGARVGAVVAGAELARRWPELGERAGAFALHTLEPLGEAEFDALLRELIRPVEYVSAELLADLRARAHGVPGLLIEWVRALERSGALAPDPATGEWRLMPNALLVRSSTPLLEALAKNALSHLPGDFQDVARLCAVLGDGSLEQLSRALSQLPRSWGASSLDARRALERVAGAGLVAFDAAGYRFHHRLMAEALERTLSPPARRALHRAAWLSASLESGRARRAFHAEAAQEHEAAQQEYLAAADEALRARRDLDAEVYLSAALQQPAGAARSRARWLWLRALARRRSQRFREALDDIDAALALGADEVTRVELLLERATAQDWLEDFAAGTASTEEAARAARTGSLPEPTGLRLSLAEGRSAFRLGDWEKAVVVLGPLAARAQGLDAECEAVSRALLGATLVLLQRLGEAEAEFARAIACCREHHDFVHLGVALSNRVHLHFARGQLEAALGELREAVNLAREHALPQNERWNSHNLAQSLTWLGDASQALPLAERAHQLGVRFYGDRISPTSTLLLARLRFQTNDTVGAERLARPVLARRSSLSPSDAVQAELLSLWLDGEPSPWAWSALAESAEGLPPDEQTDLWAEAARAHLRAGRRALAARCLAEARRCGSSGTTWVWQRALSQLDAS